MTSSIKRAVVLAAAVTLLASSGCGGESLAPFERGGSPPPPDCIKRWNAEESAQELGRHFYSQGHDSRAGHVEELDLPGQNLTGQCLAVFAARESDREYGTLGMFSNAGGWVLMNELPVSGEKKLIEVQRLGSRQANVELSDDGKIAPFN